jgi:hypothetical protein
MGDLIVLEEKKSQKSKHNSISWFDPKCPECGSDLEEISCGGSKCLGDERVFAGKLVCKKCDFSSNPFLY